MLETTISTMKAAEKTVKLYVNPRPLAVGDFTCQIGHKMTAEEVIIVVWAMSENRQFSETAYSGRI